MGNNRKGSKNQGGNKKGGDNVPKNLCLAKQKLSPYPNEDGTPFYIGDAEDGKSFLTDHDFLAAWNGGLSGGGGDRRGQLEVAQAHSRSRRHQNEEDRLRRILLSEEGTKFLKALKVSDVGQTKNPGEDNVKDAVDTWVDFLDNNNLEPLLKL